MNIKIQFILIGLLFTYSCGNRYKFDFSGEWTWNQLKSKTSDEKVTAQIINIEKNLTIQEARFLFLQLSSLKNPADIIRLSEIEKNQKQSGGGFYGFVPDFFSNSGDIPIPDNFNNLMACADFLSKIRNHIDQVIARANFPYHKTFLNQELLSDNIYTSPQNLDIDINTDAIHKILIHYINKDMTQKAASEIANTPSFQQMLLNRKNSGYIPPPHPETEDLANFIFTAGCDDPILMIWKWINPWNCFGFADLYMNCDKYYEIVSTINENQDLFAFQILNRINKYLPPEFEFHDELNFGVNWGVLSWSTDNQIGINLIHFKDDYNSIYRYASRELFRKIQIQILKTEYGIQPNENVKINDMVAHKYQNIYDKFFYEVLVQILLKGTTAYVSGKEKDWIIADGNKYGKDLLNQIYFSLYEKVDLKMVDYCESEGFKYNGPLVSIGYRITQELVKKYGDGIIYEILRDNYLEFYTKYIEIEKGYSQKKFKLIEPKISEKINHLKTIG